MQETLRAQPVLGNHWLSNFNGNFSSANTVSLVHYPRLHLLVFL